MAVRKNVASLTSAEKTALVAAIKGLKSSGKYNEYVVRHVQAMNTATPSTVSTSVRNAAHRGPAFLPWHREYLRLYELDLQAEAGDQSLGLPYWDWSSDAALPNPATAPVWANDLMGGSGNPVSTGPFAYNASDPNTWVTVNSSGNPAGGLRRAFGGAPTLPSQADVNAALGHTPYDSAPWHRSSTPSFRNVLEGWINTSGTSGNYLHNRVHVWIGGDMLPGTSPNDPVFFLHHCFIDKLWADWQRQNSGAAYAPMSGGPQGHNWNDQMSPWTTTPQDVWNHIALGYIYDTEAQGCRNALQAMIDRVFRRGQAP